MLQKDEAEGTVETTQQMLALCSELEPRLRLGAFGIIQGTLSAMSPQQYPIFRQTVANLIVADNQVDLFEFFLHHHLIVHLDRCFHKQPIRQRRYKQIDTLRSEAGAVISILACVGQQGESEQRRVFAKAMATVFGENNLQRWFVPKWDHQRLTQALQKLSQATPAIKKRILSAAVVAISDDSIFTVEEVELFRAMAESIDCPVPPLLATRQAE